MYTGLCLTRLYLESEDSYQKKTRGKYVGKILKKC